MRNCCCCSFGVLGCSVVVVAVRVVLAPSVVVVVAEVAGVVRVMAGVGVVTPTAVPAAVVVVAQLSSSDGGVTGERLEMESSRRMRLSWAASLESVALEVAVGQ
jgi:uncharacterized membrane protein